MQLYVQQVNSALEETSQKVLTGMPRIMKDAQVRKRKKKMFFLRICSLYFLIKFQNLQNDALSMRTRMIEVQNDIAQVQKKTGACMEKLENLDEMKTKLQVYFIFHQLCCI